MDLESLKRPLDSYDSIVDCVTPKGSLAEESLDGEYENWMEGEEEEGVGKNKSTAEMRENIDRLYLQLLEEQQQ